MTLITTAAHRTLVAIFIFVTLSAANAEAQRVLTTAEARELFGEATKLAEGGMHRQAANRFRQVLSVRNVPPVQYNLAFSLKALNEYAEADEWLQRVIDDPQSSDSLRQDARTLRADMEKRGGWLTIRLSGDTSGVFVLLDEREVSSEFLGKNLRVSARKHRVTIERGGEVLFEDTIRVARKSRESILFAVPGSDAPDASAKNVAASTVHTETNSAKDAIAQPVSEVEEDDGTNWILWGAIVGGVILVGTGVAIGVALSQGEDPIPVHQGDFEMGVITWD